MQRKSNQPAGLNYTSNPAGFSKPRGKVTIDLQVMLELNPSFPKQIVLPWKVHLLPSLETEYYSYKAMLSPCLMLHAIIMVHKGAIAWRLPVSA